MKTRSAQEIWEAALGELELQVNKSNYQTWLRKTEGLAYQDNQFVLGVPNTFVAEYLDKNQRSLIEKTLIGLTHRNIKVVFTIDTRHQSSPSSYGLRGGTPPISSSQLNSKYTFDSFIVGNCNRLAYTAALKVTQNPGHSYNPLFIYGGVGLGKTHLLHAIGHAAQAANIQMLYVTAEQFTNDFITAVQQGKTEEFRNKYRSVDMLLIDDIRFLSGKDKTQESFFHTFNELHNTNRQIAITSDCLPKSVPQLQEQLRSRFEWGLTAGIQPPDFETCLAILRVKAEQKEVNIALDALEFIAQQARKNVRELEGALNRVIAYARLVRALVTPELATKALENIADKAYKTPSTSPSLVIEAVANSFQLTSLDLKSRKRDKKTALARQVAMYLIRQETNCSLTQIGQELGGRDHSTVIHACEKIVNDLDISPYLKRKLLDIQQRIYPKQKV